MLGQFSDFYQSLDADPAKRGKQFEHFVKWFLKADPEWATQVDIAGKMAPSWQLRLKYA